jgi:hypothetical protein
VANCSGVISKPNSDPALFKRWFEEPSWDPWRAARKGANGVLDANLLLLRQWGPLNILKQASIDGASLSPEGEYSVRYFKRQETPAGLRAGRPGGNGLPEHVVPRGEIAATETLIRSSA